MSLTVSIIAKEQGYDTGELEKQITAPHNDLFGFESLRKTLWGHPIMQELGCSMICSLRENDVYAYGDDVSRLKEELIRITGNIDTVCAATGFDRNEIQFRIDNALEAIRVVEHHIDKVGIVLW